MTWCKYVSGEVLVAMKNHHLIGLNALSTKMHETPKENELNGR
jgi:hypothetical protein